MASQIKKVGKPCRPNRSYNGGGAQARARAGNVSDLKNLGPPPQFLLLVVKSRRETTLVAAAILLAILSFCSFPDSPF